MSRSIIQTVATLALSLGLFLLGVSEPLCAFGTDFGMERRRSRSAPAQQGPGKTSPPLVGATAGPGYAASGQMPRENVSSQPASQSVRRPITGAGTPNSVQNSVLQNSATPNRQGTQPVAEARRPHPSVARVIAFGRSGQQFGSGTFVGDLGEYGIVLTNWHVVNEADGLVHVHFPSGFGSYGAVIAVDDVWDLAAIAISKPRKGVPKLPIARNVPKPGEPLWIVGYGAGIYRMAGGRCLRYLSPQESAEAALIDLSVDAREGDSGGPILNEDGQVAGVLFGSDYRNTVGSNCVKVQEFLDKVLPLFKNLHADPETLFGSIERGGPKRRLTDTRKPQEITPQPRAANSTTSPPAVATRSRGAERSAVYRQSGDADRGSYIRQQSFSVLSTPDEPPVKMVSLSPNGAEGEKTSAPRNTQGRVDRRSTAGWLFSLLISSPLLVFLLRRTGRR